MTPKKSASDDPQGSLFQVELVKIIDISHPLAVLAEKIDWSVLKHFRFCLNYSSHRALA